ncbi:hypothetical protein GGTG_05807 [Gaeumannomyces tritici R3-111a-1]|uniref:Zn(2)-C6 fungal-type domain-containing protein n=1 Tax=Gaeumannomyces tritici (strain R3-111a-1) TaxID=644352 RepID=J3NWZ7_GAET3|nr:hypothetical protein GGTG_05807 [Gaeumannomyces tritici R3-111a-1]EJT75879.1 hypothetical protein GGTG_05807 [Gaeumannomyces tritici R3-111a-1]
MAGRPSLSGSSPASGGVSPASSASSRSTVTPTPAAAGDPFPLRPTDSHYHHPASYTRGDGPDARDAASRTSLDPRYQHHDPHPPAAASAESDQAGDPKKPRACESCRGLKVRCDPDPADPEGSCRRCAKAGRSCVVTQPTRKRQKKTDSRVTELEKKIDALTASLHATRRPAASDDNVALPPLLPNPASLSPALAAKAGGGADDRVSDSSTEPGVAYSSPTAASQAGRRHSTAASGAGPAAVSSSATAAVAAVPVTSGVEPPNRPASTGDWEPVLSGCPISATPGTHTHVNAYGLVLEKVATDDDGSRAPPINGAGCPAGAAAHAPGPVAGTAAGQKRKFAATSAAPDDEGPPAAASASRWSPDQIMGSDYEDVVSRDLVPAALAGRLWARYTDHMCPHLPGVVFPSTTTWSQVRRDRPLLFLAIMAAASSETPQLQRVLVKELMQILAEKLVVLGEKSIEVVQALHVAVFWYWPPEHFEELKFYQMIHMAAVLAIDIGLGSRRRAGAPLRGRLMPWNIHQNNPFHGPPRGPGGGGLPNGPPLPPGPGCPRKAPPPDPCSIESRRTWLTCYFLASNTSMTLHRPNLIRWTPFMTECLEVLQSSPDAAPTDAYFCHLVWTHRLSEEVGIQFNMEDPTAAIDLADPRTRHAIRGFEREIERYSAAVPPALMRPSLKLGFHVLSLYMHEIALRNEDGIEDNMRPGMGPSAGGAAQDDGTSQDRDLSGSIKGDTNPTLQDGRSGGSTGDSTNNISVAPLTPAHIQALSACIVAIDGIFDTFLGMSPEEVRCLPVFNFVRVAYATVVLIKMHFAAARPGSEMGRVIEREDIRVDQHLGSLLEKFRLAGEDDRSRPAAKFHLVLSMLRSWFQKQGRATNARSAGNSEQDSRGSGVGAATGAPGDEQNHAPRAPPAQSGHRGGPPQTTVNNITATTIYTPQNRPLDVEPAMHRQHRQTDQPQPSFIANTPLQVLSELAANDARGVAVPATADRFSGGSAPPWATTPSMPQAFMYGPDAADAAASGGRGRGEGEGAAGFSQHQVRGETRQTQLQSQQQQQWMGSASIDPGNFGDGVVQAMDLTYGGGLTLLGSGDSMYSFDSASAAIDGGGFGDLASSMRSFGVAEPLWFGSFLESTGMDAQFHHQF